jgi:chemotaxis protein MotB
MKDTGAKSHRTTHIEVDDDDHGEDSWIVSYADMVTLLFGFFVILYSFSTLDDKKFEQMTEKMAEAFKAKEIKASESDVGVSEETRQLRAFQMLVAMLNLGESMDEAVAKIERSFASEMTAASAKALLTEKAAARNKGLVNSFGIAEGDDFSTIELILPAETLFPSGGHALSKGALAQLHELADDLRQVAGLQEIGITGHTDSAAPGKGAFYDNNFTLSSLRAGSVAAVLIKYGVDQKKIAVSGMGSLRPLAQERDALGRPSRDGMAKNRRVSITLKLRRPHAATAH